MIETEARPLGNAAHLLAITVGTLLNPATPTAIFCGNDEMAQGVLAAARDLGVSVPDRLSVVGFDDAPAASLVTPRLTTVRQPLEEIGDVADLSQSQGPNTFFTTADAARYCGYRTTGALRKAAMLGRIKPVGRRGGNDRG